MKKEEEYEEDGEENGCEGWVGVYKPHKVKYRIITEGEENVCIDKDENTLEMLIDSLQMKAWNLGDFKVIVLGRRG